MKQFVVDYLARECEGTQRIARCIRDHQDADLLIEMDSGRKIAVYIVNRAIRLGEIRERYEENTRRRVHTLFVVDGRMLPFEQTETEPPPWMNALHLLTHGRVYAYSCARRDVSIRPIHIEWRWGDSARRVELGQPIKVGELRPSSVTAGAHSLDGTFATADFGEGAFWKQRDPNENRQFNYTWRAWTHGTSAQKSRTDVGGDAGWDSWEEFQRAYGDAGEYMGSADGAAFDFEFGNYGHHSSTSGKHPRRKTVAQAHHYAALGLTKGTSDLTIADVKKAYRLKARQNHPDMHPNEKDKYTARMAEINAAFEAISKDLE